MNSTSYFYNHSSQWRYETVTAEELLSPMADKSRYTGHLIDFNVRAERMGWLPSAPQLGTNPLTIAGEAEKAGMNPVDYTVKSLKEGSIRFAAEQPENGKTTRATCSSGVLTCSVLPVKVMSLCSSTCWGRSTVSVVKIWATGRREAGRSGLAGQWSGRQAGSGGYAGLPSVEHLSLFRHHFADGDLGYEKTT